ncbi:hypothetical protein EJ04DRAFT_354251 [Polyplosphaeria fusca]|uniref:Uncharacterized protein n=1 Tax=Polyplosphaeria fusca TaxID=682080 RepID=A0A9P4R9I2_9PLEO|nr:hypothetical protein EJ04DRAFT_354251 [Polyplosphaeria fusca]
MERAGVQWHNRCTSSTSVDRPHQPPELPAFVIWRLPWLPNVWPPLLLTQSHLTCLNALYMPSRTWLNLAHWLHALPSRLSFPIRAASPARAGRGLFRARFFTTLSPRSGACPPERSLLFLFEAAWTYYSSPAQCTDRPARIHVVSFPRKKASWQLQVPNDH